MRTPLAILRLHAQNAQAASTDAERQKALGFLIGGVDRLTRVVNQLLTLARVEPRLGQRATRVDLGEVVTDVLADLTPWILDRGLEPSLDLSEGDHALMIDSGALGIALQNLVSNAVEHSPPGGRITVSLRRLANRFELVVEDEGPGLDEANLVRVFERFYSRNSPNGAGLGLSIVATIVERLGGRCAWKTGPLVGWLPSCRFPCSKLPDTVSKALRFCTKSRVIHRCGSGGAAIRLAPRSAATRQQSLSSRLL
ncbi:HAMP domain-containing sensor histidine kinase [Pseudomonas sp. P1B16]|nr:HAMP domain-containing sensor histidine kinase [Pseudomonas sp. P1B16]